VVVTGGNGFMGRALMDHYRSQGAEVCGIDVVPDAGRDVVAGDIGDPASWCGHLHATDLLVHTAAIVSNNVAPERAWCVNVVGTRRVVDAAAAAAVGRVVYVSTMGVARFAQARPIETDQCLPGAVLDERLPLMSTGNPYTDTKIAAEHTVLAAHAAGEVPCTIVRPADVYGPGCRPWVLEPIAALRSGRFLLPARGQGLFTPIYIDDLVDGIARAAAHPAAAGRIVQFGGETPVTTLDYFGYLARMLGQRDPPRHVSTPVAVVVAEAVRLSARARGRHTELGRGVMQMLAKTRPVSNELAHELLGWWPQVDLDEGMARVEAWLHAEGLIDPADAVDRA
jgi:nucleoside-diphosphate-sugar epimerase